MDTLEIIEDETKTIDTDQSTHQLIVHNDDHNTFDWVIDCLMTVCDHEFIQATQCANIVHNNGKCSVKRGTFETISEMKTLLLGGGLTVSIEPLGK